MTQAEEKIVHLERRLEVEAARIKARDVEAQTVESVKAEREQALQQASLDHRSMFFVCDLAATKPRRTVG